MEFETVIIFHKVSNRFWERDSEQVFTENEFRTNYEYVNTYIFPLKGFNPGMVYEELQNDFGQNYNHDGKPNRSLSVGDIIVCVKTSKMWEVSRFGFTPLDMNII